jgi:hypothetical protein
MLRKLRNADFGLRTYAIRDQSEIRVPKSIYTFIPAKPATSVMLSMLPSCLTRSAS